MLLSSVFTVQCPKMEFWLRCQREKLSTKREKEGGELLFGLDAKRVRKDQ